MANQSITVYPGDTITVSCVQSPPQQVPSPAPVPVPTSPLGVNLTGPDDWNCGARTKLFSDLWRTARCISGNPPERFV